MRQQINLYQDILIDKPEKLQSRQAGIWLLLVLLCLVLVSIYSYWTADTLSSQVAALRIKLEEKSKQIAELEKQYPARQKDPLLADKIQRLEREIQGQKKALNYFVHRDDKNNDRILASLEGLAQHPFAGVWLEQIRLSHGGDDVHLAGSALQADQIPTYLQMIGDQQIFGGKVFAQLTVNRLKERAGQVDFVLESAQGASR